MAQTVEQCCREFLATEDLDPFTEGKIRRHHRRSTLVAVGEDAEQQLCADPIERHKSELIDLCCASHKSMSLATSATTRVTPISSLRSSHVATSRSPSSSPPTRPSPNGQRSFPAPPRSSPSSIDSCTAASSSRSKATSYRLKESKEQARQSAAQRKSAATRRSTKTS